MWWAIALTVLSGGPDAGTSEPPECDAARARVGSRWGTHECQPRPLGDGGVALAYVLDFRTIRLSFPSGSAQLSDDDRGALKDLARLLGCGPSITASIEGHTDATEPARLATKRAAAVREALIASGAPAERVTVTAYGASRPLETNESAAGRVRNRRVEVQLR